ncbi:chromosomal protein,like chromosomal protein xcap-e [Thalassiosira pseudonana CCMP1335]|uniref:Structural maintenance of chromosomes protein n=1 Tax=Thalassiosira pseudonana TaxID=35128 RepID=B8BQT7_THAPS|nr:chromosomal protein,like chromosomal protein xcap-e [Thalassiosira pseudonana CCMP1335]EED95842.1 chromosomal protein,like chromosomal protein xcap-e [Thalassiosira pseudonana CCMP1335]|eukprot:g942.t1 g942   contig10:1041306-1045480(+)
MHIKEIVVDGFKSYAHRTVIAGFDPHFNAITGLNGSGKSNILDSICFVLGITNLSQVRAGNLSELVYKQGQAGVNKASVTIVFDNEDESSSPVGYEQCKEVNVTRQVLIGGKSKYLINGRNSPAGQVANLFHSVQLNVNNPHFLIMQGRITKVLNMKPDEILGMVEEAAGTRMYENKKNTAIKTIEKKQMKVDEINSILSEEITPTLERLRGEKQQYLKWSKNNADIERIERFVVASEYMSAQETLSKNSEDVAQMEEVVAMHEETMRVAREEVEAKEGEMAKLSEQMNSELESSHNEAKAEEEKRSKDLVKATSALENKKSAVATATKELHEAQSYVSESKNAITQMQSNISKELDSIQKAKDEALSAEATLERLNKEYQNMCAGISSEEGEEGRTLPEQISKAYSDANNAEARSKQAGMKIEHLAKSLKSVEKDMKKEEASASKLSKKRDVTMEKVEGLRAEISKTDFSETEFNALETEKIDLENSVSGLQEKVDTLSAQLEGRLAFNYSDPVRGFDRSKVKGLVARLINVKLPKHSTALEVVAGGKLYQVVVDEAITGKALLNNGKLQRRVTIIPLDKVVPRNMTSSTVGTASDMAKRQQTTAQPAIELVGFDEEVRTAIEYVFGSTLVVDGMKAANSICDATKTRTVTLDGDVYEPSGLISGGSKDNLGSTLGRITELSAATAELKEKSARLRTVVNKLESMSAQSKQFDKLSGDLEIASSELAGIDKHISQTSYGMLKDKFDAMTKEVADANEEVETMKKTKEEKWELYNELKEKEAQLTLDRENRLKDVEAQVKKAKENVVAKENAAREAEVKSQEFELEIESSQKDVVAANEAVVAAEKALQAAVEEEEELSMKVGELKALYDEAKASLTELENNLKSCSDELSSLAREKSKLIKKAETAELEGKKMSVKITKFHSEKSKAEKILGSMMNKYAWIETEKEAFGVAGGDYDFEETCPNLMSKQLKDLQAEQTSLAKKINKKVMGMIEKAEGEYTELLRKRKVVENDKKKIETVIENLDVKKKVELERTWKKVNKDFGSIFSTLLPGTMAKLVPPKGMAAWEGLEVKVAFGNCWKQSLSELSGGQRSLIALSLILSLLLYKPAPMYILDEVDAALDLSHTQNIGNMLKTHFSQSQFIVVSLKEGMFNNANVIFRTKFVDGVSTVSRTIGSGANQRPRGLLTDQDNTLANERAKKRRGGRGENQSGKENSVEC